jgi:hypothetical protein
VACDVLQPTLSIANKAQNMKAMIASRARPTTVTFDIEFEMLSAITINT